MPVLYTPNIQRMKYQAVVPDSPKLLDRMRAEIRVRHYSLRTAGTYIQWIKHFIPFHDKRHSLEMGEQETTAFLTCLTVGKHVAPSTQNQALSGILFLKLTDLTGPRWQASDGTSSIYRAA